MTCKDCFFHDVCKARLAQFGINLKDEYEGVETICKVSGGFKDKSLIVELPAKPDEHVHLNIGKKKALKVRLKYVELDDLLDGRVTVIKADETDSSDKQNN